MIPNELHVSQEDQLKLDISKQETINLRERELRCPNCKFLINKLYSDISGHIQFKCPKCKEVYIMNLALFRTRSKSLYVTLIKVIE